MPAKPPAASIVIPTRNRSAELTQLLESAAAQSVPVEIIVCDDASDDPDSVRAAVERIPQARLLRSNAVHGPSFQRNRGIEAASCDVVFAPDDDSIFQSRYTVEQTLAEFSHPRVAAVGIPYVNVKAGDTVLQRAPDNNSIWAIYAFVGAAHAVRRQPFMALGGYREHFFYMGEEGDLCLRWLAQGLITRAGRADAVHHLESPERVSSRADFHGRRNDVLFAWHNAPTAWLIPQLLGTTWNGLRIAISSGRWRSHMSGTAAGWRAIFRGAHQRKPVSHAIYRTFRSMRKRGPKRLEDILPLLPDRPTEDTSIAAES